MKALPRSEATMQASRRLDWRFLLPRPQLRRVAYWGPANTTLAQALQQFSESFTPFSGTGGATSAENSGLFDLAVLVSPTPAQLEFAASRLTTEGCIYAEMQSAWGSAEERKRLFFTNIFVGIESYLTTLHRLGFAEASTYWHRPSFEKSLQLIPLNDQLALAFVFSQRAADLFSQLKLATGRSLLKTDWLLRLFQSVSLIACRLPANGK